MLYHENEVICNIYIGYLYIILAILSDKIMYNTSAYIYIVMIMIHIRRDSDSRSSVGSLL